jgi:hypothetical protein
MEAAPGDCLGESIGRMTKDMMGSMECEIVASAFCD